MTYDLYDRAEAEQKAQEDAALRFLSIRKGAYFRVFSGNGSPDDAKLVLGDLQAFCHATTSTYDPDPRNHALQEGHREVILRILDHMHLDIEELYRKYR